MEPKKYYITRSGRAKAKGVFSKVTLSGRVLHYLSVGTRGVTGRTAMEIKRVIWKETYFPLNPPDMDDIRRALAGLIKKGYVSLKLQGVEGETILI